MDLLGLQGECTMTWQVSDYSIIRPYKVPRVDITDTLIVVDYDMPPGACFFSYALACVRS